MLALIIIVLTVAVAVSVVFYLRALSLRQFEHAVQARIDAMRSAAELREISATTSRRLRDHALDEMSRRKVRRP